MDAERSDWRTGLDPQRFGRAGEVLERHVRERSTPGAVGLLVRGGGGVACWVAGRHTYEPDAPEVSENDLYDLASLTKVVVTTSICMALQPGLDLDERVGEYVPAFRGDGWDVVTISHLLAHCAGLPAHQRFFETCQGKEGGAGGRVQDAAGVPAGYQDDL